MLKLMSFVCPELDVTYDEVYTELAQALELTFEEASKRFSPDDAVARLKYHRRQAGRRAVFQELADELGVDATTVFAACSVDGAKILLDAVRAKREMLV
ncbi:MAG TPA: hypothetical protein V6D47_21945 [Oscillatoriaceae cyanobacterium]